MEDAAGLPRGPDVRGGRPPHGEEVLRHAGHLTTGQLRERIRRLAICLDPEAAAERYRHAVDGRRFVSEPTDDGTADLMILDAPPDRAAAARRHIDRIARSLRSPTEPRSIDQLRADVALDLLTGRTPTTGTSTARGGGVGACHHRSGLHRPACETRD